MNEMEKAAEIDAAVKDDDVTMVAVPTELVAQVLALIKRRRRPA